MYESSQQVAPGVVVHYARSTPTFWGAHYVLCLHGPNGVCWPCERAHTLISVGTYESTFARVLTEFDTSQLTLLAWNAPDRPNGFVPRPPPPAVEKKAVSDEENILNSSKRQSWTNSLEAYAEHAVTLMQNLFYTPFSILAHDDGAVTAMHVAAKHAAYVRAVVIWQCTAKITPRHLQELKGSRVFARASAHVHSSTIHAANNPCVL
jgi:pimeloyl-ACP methyl ester carboxylesterase